MIGYLPGTTVEMNMENGVQDFLNSLFAANGLVLSQVLQLTGLSAHTVQNWVKRKFVSPPVGKKYDCDQFCTIVIINMLNDTFQIDQITRMIDYIKATAAGAPTLIYTCFADLLALVPADAIRAATKLDAMISSVLHKHSVEKAAQDRLKKVLKIMLLAHISAQIKGEATLESVSYTHLDVYKRQCLPFLRTPAPRSRQ